MKLSFSGQALAWTVIRRKMKPSLASAAERRLKK
jgi:hypothetical protein